ncbi:MAG: hypothetical protein Q8R28_20560 [Dehalococcoidia bacterium]|nr:hypothetical protein [Dehalococcoidia bacterium]
MIHDELKQWAENWVAQDPDLGFQEPDPGFMVSRRPLSKDWFVGKLVTLLHAVHMEGERHEAKRHEASVVEVQLVDGTPLLVIPMNIYKANESICGDMVKAAMNTAYLHALSLRGLPLRPVVEDQEHGEGRRLLWRWEVVKDVKVAP